MEQQLSYTQLAHQLKQASIALSPAELHGFLSGLICGGVQDQSWQPLLYQFTNDGQAYPQALLQQASQLYQEIYQTLADVESFDFQLLLPSHCSVFAQADSLSEWTNHFLLGLGLAQPRLTEQGGDIGEALADLSDICRLGYDEDDDPEELSGALEEIIEYVRTLANLFFTEFQPKAPPKTVLH